MSAAKQLIIFVCTSNTCRSPMSEAFGKDFMAKRGLDGKYEIISRSISEDYEPVGSPPSSQGVQVLKEDFGLNIMAHRSTLLTGPECARATAIFGVTRGHVEAVTSLFPDEVRGKIKPLPHDVSDPWHAPVSVYRACASAMKPLVEEVLSKFT